MKICSAFAPDPPAGRTNPNPLAERRNVPTTFPLPGPCDALRSVLSLAMSSRPALMRDLTVERYSA